MADAYTHMHTHTTKMPIIAAVLVIFVAGLLVAAVVYKNKTQDKDNTTGAYENRPVPKASMSNFVSGTMGGSQTMGLGASFSSPRATLGSLGSIHGKSPVTAKTQFQDPYSDGGDAYGEIPENDYAEADQGTYGELDDVPAALPASAYQVPDDSSDSDDPYVFFCVCVVCRVVRVYIS